MLQLDDSSVIEIIDVFISIVLVEVDNLEIMIITSLLGLVL